MVAGDQTGFLKPWCVSAATAFAVLIAILPILLHPHLPLVDLPNHIARHYIAANPSTALDSYYSYTFAMKGNSAGDLLWLTVGQHITDVYTFSKLLMAFYAANLLLSVMVLARVLHGYWSIWSLATLLLVFNAPFFWGFQNFVVTVPLALYALAAWIHYEGVRPWLRAIFFLPVVLVIFELHILGFVAVLVSVFGREVHRLFEAGRQWHQHLLRHYISALPFLFPLGLAFWAALTAAPNEYGDITRYGSLRDRFDMLMSPVDAVSNDGSVALAFFGTLSLAALIVAFLTLPKRSGLRLVMAPRALGPILALAVLSLMIPSILDGVALVQIRFPFVLAAVAIAGTSWHWVDRRQALGVFLVFAFLAVGRSVAVEQLTARYSADMQDLSSVLTDVPEGARLFPVRMSAARINWHLQAHAVPQANAFVPTLFRGAHALQVDEAWQHIAAAQGLSLPAYLVLGDNDAALSATSGYWDNWESDFTHLLALDNLDEDLVASRDLRLLGRQGRFEIYQIGSQSPEP
jgi:hypothetical protein